MLGLGLTLSLGSSGGASLTPVDVVFGFGQSWEPWARDNVSELPGGANYYSPDPYAYIWDVASQSIVPLIPGPLSGGGNEQQPGNAYIDPAYQDGIGWTPEYLRRVRLVQPTREKLFFGYAIGGSRFTDASAFGRGGNWDVTLSDGAYALMLAEWNAFKAALLAQGKTPNITVAMTDLGISSSSGTAGEASSYEASMTALIAQMRTDIIGNAKLVIQRVCTNIGGFTQKPTVRAGQQNIVLADPTRCELMNMDGTQLGADVVHPTAPSIALLGRNIYFHEAGLWYPMKDIAELGATIYPTRIWAGGDLRDLPAAATAGTALSSIWEGSGANAHQVQATAAKQPLLATTTLASGLVARSAAFDGVVGSNGDYTLKTSDAGFNQASGFGFFCAMKAPATNGGTVYAEASGTVTNPFVSIRADGSGNLMYIGRNDAGTIFPVGGPVQIGGVAFDNTMHFIAVNDDLTSISGQVDGTAGTPVSYSRGTTTITQCSFGATRQVSSTAINTLALNLGIAWRTNIPGDATYNAKARVFCQREYGTP